MKMLRISLGMKITGTVLLVVLCFGAFVWLTNRMVSDVSREITSSTQEVEGSYQKASDVLETVASASEFDRKVVAMLTTQLRMNQLNKRYLATEDAVVQMDHDELAEQLAALMEETATADSRIVPLMDVLSNYQENFILMDDKILDMDLEKAQQISVTALDSDAHIIVEALQQMLDESSARLAADIQAATEAGQASVTATKGLESTGAQLQETTRSLSMVAGVLIVVCTGLAVLMPRLMVRNLVKMMEAMREVAEGDLTHNLDIRSGDEVGKLGYELNKMMEQLREMIRKVVSVSVHLATASEQMSASTSQIASSSEQIGTQTQTMATATNQMAVTVGEMADNAQSVKEVSGVARAAASEGGQVIGDALGVFSRLQEVVGSAAGLVDTLGEQSNKIGVVVEVIEDVADQTNLLALNAAIEAARAGEHGRGFAVVADEVRKLAEKTMNATQEIGATVQTIQSDGVKAVSAMREGQETVESGAGRAGKASSAVQDIEENILRTNDQATQIAAGSEEMSVIVKDLANRMDEVAKGVEHTASATGEISRTAQTMAAQAEELRTLASRFRV